jgi:hypothetical protein
MSSERKERLGALALYAKLTLQWELGVFYGNIWSKMSPQKTHLPFLAMLFSAFVL